MKILMLAPQPFYEERGTLIAIDLLLQALSERGDSVDLLTLHLGDDRIYPGLRVFRIKPWPRPRMIKPGFSLRKIWCDVFLFFCAIRMARATKYDVVHAVEEAGFVALLLKKMFGLPYVLDVDSSMSTQIVDRFQWLSPLTGLLDWMESRPARSADAVVPMCESLADQVATVSNGKIFVLHDICLPGDPKAPADDLRELLRLGSKLIVMYVGNLEPYQGIDLLLDSFAIVTKKLKNVSLIVIGGRSGDIEHYTARSENLGLAKSVKFVGPRPVKALSNYLHQADVLVSPRIQGTNTPMKIYSYLGSGRAVVATNLTTHTQVMDHHSAALADVEPAAFASALVTVLADENERDRLGQNAVALVEEKFSWPAFRRQVDIIFDTVENGLAGPGVQ